MARELIVVVMLMTAACCHDDNKNKVDQTGQIILEPEPEKLPCRTCVIEVHSGGDDFLVGKFEAGEGGVPKYPVKDPTLVIGGDHRVRVESPSPIDVGVAFSLKLPSGEDPETWTGKSIDLEALDSNGVTCVQEDVPLQM